MINYKMKLMNLLKKTHLRPKKAFTLVELIVTITILAVLWTISFIWYGSYTKDARNSKRLSDLKNMEKSLEFFLLRNNKVAGSDFLWEVTLSWKQVLKQWYFSEDLAGSLWITWNISDPLDSKDYIISTFNKKYQLLWFLENTWNYDSIEERVEVYYWDDLGVFLEEDKDSIVYKDNNLEVNDISEEVDLYLNNNISSFSSWSIDVEFNYRVNYDSSCKAILKNGKSNWSWYYDIDINSDWNIDNVYCDMDNWWWTWLFSVTSSWSTWKFDSTEWINPTLKSWNFLTEEVTYNSYANLKTNYIKICRADLQHCYIYDHNLWKNLIDFFIENISYTQFSVFEYKNSYSSTHMYNVNWPENIGDNDINNYFESFWFTYSWLSGFNKYWVWINLYSKNKLWFQADNNNNWPNFDNKWLWIWVHRSYDCRNEPVLSVSIHNTCLWDNENWYVFWK